MNKQEKNIVDILTFDEIEDIVYVFINKLYHTDKTVALLTNRELVEYAMDELLTDENISVKKVNLELDSEDIEYMISVDDNGYMVVQPVEYYDDKYFKGIEYVFVDIDGCVSQVTIDNLLDRDVPVVLFGEEDCECDECECACCKYEKSAESKPNCKDNFVVKVKCDLDAEEAKEIITDMEKRIERMNDMFREMDAFRKLFRW